VETLVIILIIAILAVVQSIFGMGLLVFGTPALPLLGLPFSQTLAWLLPASAAISAIQVAADPSATKEVWRGGRPFFCLVPLVASLSIVLALNLHAKIDLAIGLALIAASFIRMQPTLQRWIAEIVTRAEWTYLVVMGLVHGLTNMGGALLSIYASSKSSQKTEIRGTVSSYYLLFGLVQLTILVSFNSGFFTIFSLYAALLSSTIYLLVGRVIFNKSAPQIYNRAFTCFIGICGVAVIVKNASS